MKETQPIDMVTDVYIPAAIIATLFVINGIVLFFIFKRRKEVDYDDVAAEPLPNSSSEQRSIAVVEGGHSIELEAL